MVFDAILFVLSIVWCQAMVKRWRTDLAEFRQARNNYDRLAIALWWVLTIVPIWFIVSFVRRLVG